MAIMSEKGTEANPKKLPNKVKGKIIVATTINNVVIKRYFPGTLLKNGPLLRITSTIRLAEITDSMNQPVLNNVIGVLKTRRSTPKAK